MLRPSPNLRSLQVSHRQKPDSCSPDELILSTFLVYFRRFIEIESSLSSVSSPFRTSSPKRSVPSIDCRSVLTALDELFALLQELISFLQKSFSHALGFTRHYSQLSFLFHITQRHVATLSDLINSYWTASMNSASSEYIIQQRVYITNIFEQLSQVVAEVRDEAKQLTDEAKWDELEILMSFVSTPPTAYPCSHIFSSQLFLTADQESNQVSSSEAASFGRDDSSARILSLEQYRKRMRKVIT